MDSGSSQGVSTQTEAILHRMLDLTQPTCVWRVPLVAMLQSCYMETDLTRTLVFLQQGLRATHTMLQPQHTPHSPPASRFVPLDYSLAPPALDMDRWKQFHIALGFEIEQPDGRHPIDVIDVCLSAGVLPQCVHGMTVLLQLIQDLPWSVLRMVLKLSHEDTHQLIQLIQANTFSTDHIETAKRLSASFPDEMRQLGVRYHKRQVTVCGQEQVTETLALVAHTLLLDSVTDDKAVFI